jgi:hypothetical protein
MGWWVEACGTAEAVPFRSLGWDSSCETPLWLGIEEEGKSKVLGAIEAPRWGGGGRLVARRPS